MRLRHAGQIGVPYELATCMILLTSLLMILVLLASLPFTVAADSVNSVGSQSVQVINLHEHRHDHKHRHHHEDAYSPHQSHNRDTHVRAHDDEVDHHRQQATASPGGNSPPTVSKNPGVQYYKQYYNPSEEKPSGRQHGYDYSQYYRPQNFTSKSPDASTTIQAGAEGSSSNIRASGEMARGFIPNRQRQDQSAYDAARDGQHHTARYENNELDSDEYSRPRRRRRKRSGAVTTQLSEHKHSQDASVNQNDTISSDASEEEEEDSVNLKTRDEVIEKWQNISQQYAKQYVPHGRGNRGINSAGPQEDARVNVTDPSYRSRDVGEEMDLPPYTRVSDSPRNDTFPATTISLSSSSKRHEELEKSMDKAEKRNDHVKEMIKEHDKESRNLKSQQNKMQDEKSRRQNHPVVPIEFADVVSADPGASVQSVSLTITKAFMIGIACFVLVATIYAIRDHRTRPNQYEPITDQHQTV